MYMRATSYSCFNSRISTNICISETVKILTAAIIIIVIIIINTTIAFLCLL